MHAHVCKNVPTHTHARTHIYANNSCRHSYRPATLSSHHRSCQSEPPHPAFKPACPPCLATTPAHLKESRCWCVLGVFLMMVWFCIQDLWFGVSPWCWHTIAGIPLEAKLCALQGFWSFAPMWCSSDRAYKVSGYVSNTWTSSSGCRANSKAEGMSSSLPHIHLWWF